MEPRPEGRGDVGIGGSYPHRLPMLQWSHAPKGVETRGGRGGMNDRPLLQWSHAPKGVETTTSRRRFCEAPRLLQWSHAPKGVETVDHRSRVSTVQIASMEPRPEGRGDLRGGRYPRGSIGCFNGATPRRAWRRAGSRMCSASARRASMEPRPEGRGDKRMTSCVV